MRRCLRKLVKLRRFPDFLRSYGFLSDFANDTNVKCRLEGIASIKKPHHRESFEYLRFEHETHARLFKN